MAEDILDGTFEHDSLTDEALAAILKQLRKHPNVQDVNTSGKAGAQIPHLPLGDDSSPWGR
jgi:hypothetical protein